MRKESDPLQRQANREIRRILASRKLLLGRTLIVVARKREDRAVRTVQASEIGPDERPAVTSA
jgi:hypothetical protein